jgi:predicted small lipoprotein YifL
VIARRLAILALLPLALAGCGRLGPPVRTPRSVPAPQAEAAPAVGSAQGSEVGPAGEEEEERERR